MPKRKSAIPAKSSIFTEQTHHVSFLIANIGSFKKVATFEPLDSLKSSSVNG